jgi:hypothetical protein
LSRHPFWVAAFLYKKEMIGDDMREIFQGENYYERKRKYRGTPFRNTQKRDDWLR